MIAACLKWVDQRPETEAILVAAQPDERFAGVSAADKAALEWALRSRDSRGNEVGDVVAVTVGPVAAEAILRDALAAGADRAVRIDLPFGAPSRAVAAVVAAVLGEASTIWCGDYSFDRGTGSVPAFLADELGIAQALGLVEIDVEGGGFTALRRLDGGRRERLSVQGRAVLSVEGSTALLRRAPLRGLLSSRPIEVVAGVVPIAPPANLGEPRPYRPRPRTYAAPKGTTALERVRTLTAAGAAAVHGDTITLDPGAAADRILSMLTDWGYLP